MNKLLALFFVFALACPSFANTKPDDLVRVYYYVEDYNKNPPVFENKTYTKKWKDLKLDQNTRNGLIKKNSWFNTKFDDIFHIGFIMIVNDKVQRIAFQSDRGNTVMMMWPEGTYCYMNLDGNGSIFFVRGNQCFSSSGQIGEDG